MVPLCAACSLYPLPSPPNAEALMTKLEPGDDFKGGRIGQHGTPLCVHHVARVRLSIRARDSVDQMNQNGAAGGGTCLTCWLQRRARRLRFAPTGGQRGVTGPRPAVVHGDLRRP